MKNRFGFVSSLGACLLALAGFSASLTFTGCERKETLVDVETPGGEIEVERDIDTGEINVDVNE